MIGILLVSLMNFTNANVQECFEVFAIKICLRLNILEAKPYIITNASVDIISIFC